MLILMNDYASIGQLVSKWTATQYAAQFEYNHERSTPNVQQLAASDDKDRVLMMNYCWHKKDADKKWRKMLNSRPTVTQH
jgi:hypothetical protein